jgi:Flp pilus assembly protein TadD
MSSKLTTIRTSLVGIAALFVSGAVMAAGNYQLQTSEAEVYGTRTIERGEFERGAEQLNLALSVAGDARMMRAPVLNNLCVAYTMKGQLEQANAYCNDSVANGRELDLAYNNLGVLAVAQGNLAAAISNFEAALSENKSDLIARQNLRLAQQQLASLEGDSEQLASTDAEARTAG